MNNQKLLIIIPCLNEERTISSVISKIPKKIEGIHKIDILVVDDGSSDDTVKIASAAGAKTISHSVNKGVGAAFRTGLNFSRIENYDYLVNIDGDGQFNPKDIVNLLTPIMNGDAEMTTASRFKDKSLIPDMPKIKKWGNFRISSIVSLISGEKFYDVSCGFRAYSKNVIENISLLGSFTYTHEVILQAVFNGFSVVEVPLKVRGEREYGTSRVASNLWHYAKQTSSIIGLTLISYRPFKSFAVIASLFLIVGLSLGGFFIYHRLTTGAFEPHIWAGFSAAYFSGLGLIALLFGQAAFMFTRLHMVSKNEMNLMMQLINHERDKRKSESD